jgi:hypothetical protein
MFECKLKDFEAGKDTIAWKYTNEMWGCTATLTGNATTIENKYRPKACKD